MYISKQIWGPQNTCVEVSWIPQWWGPSLFRPAYVHRPISMASPFFRKKNLLDIIIWQFLYVLGLSWTSQLDRPPHDVFHMVVGLCLMLNPRLTTMLDNTSQCVSSFFKTLVQTLVYMTFTTCWRHLSKFVTREYVQSFFEINKTRIKTLIYKYFLFNYNKQCKNVVCSRYAFLEICLCFCHDPLQFCR